MDRLENLLTRLWLDIFGDTCSNPRGVVGRPCAPYPVGEASRSLPGGCDREGSQICSFMINNFPIWRRSLFQQIGIGCSIRSCPKVCLQGSEGQFIENVVRIVMPVITLLRARKLGVTLGVFRPFLLAPFFGDFQEKLKTLQCPKVSEALSEAWPKGRISGLSVVKRFSKLAIYI